MVHLIYQKYRNKRLENNVNPINVSINDTDKSEE